MLTRPHSKTGSPPANKASVTPIASLPIHSPPQPVLPHYHPASTLQPLVLPLEGLQMIVPHVAHVIASCIPVRLTAKAIRMTLLVGPLVDRMSRLDLRRSRSSLPIIVWIATM